MPIEFRFQHAAIAGGHADVDGSINHVIVGDDVSVRRDHDAAAHAVLDLGLALLHARAKELAERAVLAEELLHVVGHFCRGRLRLVREVTVTLTTAGVTRAASVSIALSRARRAPTLSVSSGAAAGAASQRLAVAGLANS